MLSIEYKHRDGLIDMDNCPDCRQRLMSLRKLSGYAAGTVTAKICVNPSCLRFVEPCHLKTWADEKGNPLDTRLPQPGGEKKECEMIYKRNKQENNHANQL